LEKGKGEKNKKQDPHPALSRERERVKKGG